MNMAIRGSYALWSFIHARFNQLHRFVRHPKNIVEVSIGEDKAQFIASFADTIQHALECWTGVRLEAEVSLSVPFKIESVMLELRSLATHPACNVDSSSLQNFQAVRFELIKGLTLAPEIGSMFSPSQTVHRMAQPKMTDTAGSRRIGCHIADISRLVKSSG